MVMNPRTIKRRLAGDKQAFNGEGQFPIS